MAKRGRSPSVSEIRLASSLIEIVSDIARRVGGDELAYEMISHASTMTRSAASKIGFRKQYPWLFALPYVGGAAKAILPLAGAAALIPALGGLQAWDWLKRKLGVDEHAGEPIPYQDSRRTGPRSDDKWWQRDVPMDVGVVPESYYVEDPAYEPWYRNLQQENAARMRSEYGGVPTTYNMIPGYAFNPKLTQGPFPGAMAPLPGSPPDAFSLYDQLTSPSPDRMASSDASERVVESQLLTQETLERPEGVREHPFAKYFQPGSIEQAAAIGGEEGWYAPLTPYSPFTDATGRFGRDDAVEWAPGWTPLETRMNMMKAMQATIPDRLSWGANWRISQILAQLHAGTISQEQASRAINGLVEGLSAMGAPPGVVDEVVQRAMGGIESGMYGGLPSRLVGGTPMPSPGAANWNAIRSPQDDPVRGPMMQGVASMEQRMRDLSGGWTSPAATSPLLEV